MVFQDGCAGTISHVIDTCCAVDTCSGDFGANRVEVYVQDLVGVADQSMHTLSRTHVPELASLVDGASSTNIATKFELCA